MKKIAPAKSLSFLNVKKLQTMEKLQNYKLCKI